MQVFKCMKRLWYYIAEFTLLDQRKTCRSFTFLIDLFNSRYLYWMFFFSETTTFTPGVPKCRPKLSKYSVAANDDDLDAKRKHYDVW